MTDPAELSAEFDDTQPQAGRRYDAWLGGKDSLAVDRASADQIRRGFPTIDKAVAENRFFVARAVAYMADQGIGQYLDIGCGYPHSPNVHEVAQHRDPSARVVYLDKDPVVAAHARALLAHHTSGRVAAIQADLRRPHTILNDPLLRATLDLDRPVGLLLCAVLHFLPDDDRPADAVTHLVHALATGSLVAVSHFTLDPLSAEIAADITAQTRDGAGHGPFRPRTRPEVAAFLEGLTLVDPGVVSIVEWHPDRPPHPKATVAQTAVYGAVGCVP